MLNKYLTRSHMQWKEFVPKSILCFRRGYSFKALKSDLWAGLTVGIVALPLAMAFAIASGVGPERGLYTAIVAGFLIALLGGSRVQIGGPAGVFVVIVYGIVQRVGYEGLAVVTLMAAVLLILMGVSRLGTWIKYVPYPLTVGFTSGIALILFSSQMKDFFGLKMQTVPVDFLSKWHAYIQAFPSWDMLTFGVGAFSLALILLTRRFFPKLPWGIVAIVPPTLICFLFHLPVETIYTRFGEMPRFLPVPSLPHFSMSWPAIQSLIPDAITIALVAGIESLLSAVVSDGMTGGRHKSNCELVAQGVANVGSVLFGGIPATGAIARTAMNVKTGAKTPMAGMIHAVTLLLFILVFAPAVGHIPLAVLSSVLIMVAWNMSEIAHFRRLLRAPLGDVAVLLTAFFLTVLVGLIAAVEVGMILAAFLFMKRMSDRSNVVVTPEDPEALYKKQVPEGAKIYEIHGPLFFGVAGHVKDLLHDMECTPKVFILRLRKVPILDASGLHALSELHVRCSRDSSILILAGFEGQPKKSLKKFGLEALIGPENIFPHLDPALHRARDLLQKTK
jgi:SulP family sulfate permease